MQKPQNERTSVSPRSINSSMRSLPQFLPGELISHKIRIGQMRLSRLFSITAQMLAEPQVRDRHTTELKDELTALLIYLNTQAKPNTTMAHITLLASKDARFTHMKYNTINNRNYRVREKMEILGPGVKGQQHPPHTFHGIQIEIEKERLIREGYTVETDHTKMLAIMKDKKLKGCPDLIGRRMVNGAESFKPVEVVDRLKTEGTFIRQWVNGSKLGEPLRIVIPISLDNVEFAGTSLEEQERIQTEVDAYRARRKVNS